MKKLTLLLIPLFFGILVLSGCQSDGHSDHSHDHGDHHGHHEESSHNEDIELEGLSFTIWTDKTELFVEFDPLIVGEETPFAAHFSNMADFKAFEKGSVEVQLVDKNGNIDAKAMVNKPSSPGIFRPIIVPKTEGNYTLSFKIKSGRIADTINIKNIVAFKSKRAAFKNSTPQPENGSEISYLKEQAWKVEFETIPAQYKKIGKTIQTTGELVQNPSGWVLKVDFPKSEYNYQKNIRSIRFQPDYTNTLFKISNPSSRYLSRAVIRKEISPYFQQFYKLTPNKTFVPGSFVTVFLETDKVEKLIAVPTQAIMETEGRFYVYVQTGGESFEKREIHIQQRNGDFIGISSGLSVGERIVTKGGYHIKLASMSSQTPAHGHAH